MIRNIPDISTIGGFNYSWDFDTDEFTEWAEEESGVSPNEAAFKEYLEDGYVTFTLEYVDHKTYHSTGEYAELDYDGVCDKYGKGVADEMVQFLQSSGKREGFIDKGSMSDGDDVDLSDPDEVNRFALKYMPHGDYSKGARGFILSNGEVVYTENEHNECTIVPGVKGTFHFIEMGNIRVLPQCIDIAKVPTPEQRRTLANVISSYADDRLYVDLINGGVEHGVTYVYPQWKVVLNEIDRFFREGIKPTDRIFTEGRIRRLVSEAVRDALNEASDGRFNVNELSSCRSYAANVRYCRGHLGAPVGNGSSRMVFQIDDDTVLKLAKNEKGVAQNRVEGEYWKLSYVIFPKIYEQDEDNLWIKCEYVLPAKAADFKKCLGVSFKDVCAFMESEMSRWTRYGYRETMSYEECQRLIDDHPTEFFRDLESWMSNAEVQDRDVMSLRNWGLALRDGQAMPVYLDHGLNQDVFDRYYKRW